MATYAKTATRRFFHAMKRGNLMRGKREKAQREAVKIIRAAGQSLIENAEKIAGGYEYQTDLDIMIRVGNLVEMPTITVTQEYVPEGWTKRSEGIEIEGVR